MLNRNRPSGKRRVASPGSRNIQVKTDERNTETAPNKAMPSGKAAGLGPRKQQIAAPKEVVSPRFRAGDLKRPRRLSRRERLQLYYRAAPQGQPPDSYETRPGRRRLFQRN